MPAMFWYQKSIVLAHLNITERFAAIFLSFFFCCVFCVTLLPLAVSVPISSTATKSESHSCTLVEVNVMQSSVYILSISICMICDV